MQQIDRLRVSIQGKLFEPESDRPRWSQLSLEVRRTVTELLVLMLSHEWCQGSGSAEKEVNDE